LKGFIQYFANKNRIWVIEQDGGNDLKEGRQFPIGQFELQSEIYGQNKLSIE
jgi:hypothetical protein